MYTQNQYIMRDQVRGLIPSLIKKDPRDRMNRLRTWLQLMVFALATLSYIAALSLTA